MRGRPPKLKLALSSTERDELERLTRSTTAEYGRVRRAKGILLVAGGASRTAAAREAGMSRRHLSKWVRRFVKLRIKGLSDLPRPGRPPGFSPSVGMHMVKLACELPLESGRSLCKWDCQEIARQLIREGLTDSISADTVWRTLANYKLKPWRHHFWLSTKTPRDSEFYRTVQYTCDLYTRPLAENEAVFCLDEKTNLQPRPRQAPTKPAQHGKPVRVEHEYKRAGAVHLFAAFNTRTGQVFGQCYSRKNSDTFIQFLTELDEQVPLHITKIHIVLDNASYHRSKAVQAWVAAHPRFVLCFLPVHCSWMNQVEQWFSVLQRKRLSFPDLASTLDLTEKILTFIDQHNEVAKPYKWKRSSLDKVLSEQGTSSSKERAA